MDLEAAKASGAVAMFGEKYDAQVRVLDVPALETSGGPSRELCGGTHCTRTGDIGSFRITLETSIAAGVRRIEAVTGRGAARAFAEDRAVLRDLALRLKARPEEIAPRVQALQDEVREARRVAEKARQEAALGAVDRLGSSAEDVEGLRVLAASVPGVDAKAMKGLWERLKKDGVQVAFLAGESEGRVPVFAAAAPEAVARGVDARALLETACGVLGGRGGGRPEMAQGNGETPSRLPDAMDAVRRRIRESAGAASRT
jgi:alanyl-tRNA synthetase